MEGTFWGRRTDGFRGGGGRLPLRLPVKTLEKGGGRGKHFGGKYSEGNA